MKVIVTHLPSGRYYAHTISPNGNVIGHDGETRIRAIIRLEAALRENGDYGTHLTIEIEDR